MTIQNYKPIDIPEDNYNTSSLWAVRKMDNDDSASHEGGDRGGGDGREGGDRGDGGGGSGGVGNEDYVIECTS